jgi:acylphosphatase
LKHLNITINGKVQGVGFRYSALVFANKLNIKGFVKNLPDGSVYIETEGTEKYLIDFINWCKIGPERAQINSINVIYSDLKYFKSFEINH